MLFNNLSEEALYYRSLTDYRLLPNGYIICMLDGRTFSTFTKKYFDEPFDSEFHLMMNETAKYLCEKISGCVLGYTQSDEITLVLKDTQEQDTILSKTINDIPILFIALQIINLTNQCI